MVRERRIKACGWAALAVGTLLCPCGHALEWRSAPAVTASAGSDSNYRLSASDNARAASRSVAVSAEIAATQPGFTFNLRPELRAQRYADDAAADRNDAFVTFGVGVNDDRQSFRFGGSYARESTLTSEFESSGVLAVDVERTQRGLDTGFSRTLSPTSNIGFALSVAKTGYGEAFGSALNDYGFRTVQVTHGRTTDERSAWNFTASKSFVDDESRDLDTSNTAVRANWSRRFSPELQGSIGFSAFVIDATEGEPGDPSGAVSFGLTRQWAQWSLSTAGARDVRPDGRGTLVVEDSLTVEMQRGLSERLNVSVLLRGARVVSSTDFFDFERDYSQTGASVRWQIARRLSLDATVYERVTDSPFARRATGLASLVSITYRGA